MKSLQGGCGDLPRISRIHYGVWYTKNGGGKAMNYVLKVKLLNMDAQIPSYAHKGDAGLDLFSSIELMIPREKVCWFLRGSAYSYLKTRKHR